MTNSTMTLFALESRTSSVDTVVYGDAVFNYSFTRDLKYYAMAREEYRTNEYASGQVNSMRTHELDMKLNYRMRMIFVDLEYRVRQIVPDNAPRATQQYTFAKISRPF